MKSEPEVFSIDDLKAKKQWHWDGVRNYTARNYMRDQMHLGDLIIFYHSSCEIPGPAGVAKVASLSYPDHTQFDSKSKYFDQKATVANPRWFMVDVTFVKKFLRVITRTELKDEPALSKLILWSHNRLSITPLTLTEFETILKMSK